jgi:type II secretory pathway component PulF
MPKYDYIAIDDFGRKTRGSLISPSEESMKDALSSMGLTPLQMKVKRELPSFFKMRRRVKRREIIDFTVHLKTLIAAGVPIVQAMYDLVEQTDNHLFQSVIADVRRNIQAGAVLSDALSLHPAVFSETYVSIVRAGETTGKLDTVLEDLIRFLEWNEELVSTVKQATLYPVIVLTAVFGLIVLLFTFVFPRFIVIFKAANVELPLPTKIVIWISAFFKANILYMIGLVLLLFVSLKLYGRREKGRYRIDKLKIRSPVVGNLIRKVELSRFAHYLSLLLRSGVDTTQSLWVVTKVVRNSVISREIERAKDELTAGASLSDSLRKSEVFSPILVRMVAAGELSGKLDETLDKVSEYYDREVPLAVKKTFAIIEPIVITILAVVVLGAALSMFLALYKMVGALSGGG